ncbi:MAG: glyoxalase [Crocinitomicaceae bacterium]
MSCTKESLRPMISTIGSQENASTEERFQNEVLRPIIKMQHDIILAYFENYLIKMKIRLEGLSGFKKKEIVSSVFGKNQQFKTELRGMIIGQLTIEEFQTYLKIANSTNKRINNMLQERVISSI